MAALRKCLECRACEDICAAHRTDEGYNPFELMQAIVEGRVEDALAHEHIWRCLECYECQERCFQRFGMVEPMKALKRPWNSRTISPYGSRSPPCTFRMLVSRSKRSLQEYDPLYTLFIYVKVACG